MTRVLVLANYKSCSRNRDNIRSDVCCLPQRYFTTDRSIFEFNYRVQEEAAKERSQLWCNELYRKSTDRSQSRTMLEMPHHGGQ